MVKQEKIVELYNRVSNEKIDNDKLNNIMFYLKLIDDKFELDIVRIIEIIDVLFEFNKNNLLHLINNESIDLLMKIVNKDDVIVDETIYLPILLKHFLFPYSLNKCQNDYDLYDNFLAEFENMLESIDKSFTINDLETLTKYNSELKDLIISYRNCFNIYREKIGNDLILHTFLSHIIGIYYFKQDAYERKDEILEEITYLLSDNYQDLINYCINEGIIDNFSNLELDSIKLKKEYLCSNSILEYFYNNKKVKRKCK